MVGCVGYLANFGHVHCFVYSAKCIEWLGPPYSCASYDLAPFLGSLATVSIKVE